MEDIGLIILILYVSGMLVTIACVLTMAYRMGDEINGEDVIAAVIVGAGSWLSVIALVVVLLMEKAREIKFKRRKKK